jgi:malate dehydrogenase
VLKPANRCGTYLNPRNFTAMTRLDHNRALAQLAARTGSHHASIRRMIIWGNHSSTQYPDIRFAEVNGTAPSSLVDRDRYREKFIPDVTAVRQSSKRGGIERGMAASAAIDHCAHGT